MKPIKFLGLILLVLGIAVLFYNKLLGGIIAFLGAVILIIPIRKLTKKRAVHEFRHKVHALKLEEQEKTLKKRAEAAKKAKERHVRMSRR